MASNRRKSVQKKGVDRMSEEGDKSGSESDMSDSDMQAYTFVDDPNVLRIAIMADPVGARIPSDFSHPT